MRSYAAIHVGSRWMATHAWGVMSEGEQPPARDLLCVGCTQSQAEALAKQLNERSVQRANVTGEKGEPTAKKKLLWFGLVLATLLCGCTNTAPLKGGKAKTVSKPAQGIEQTVVQSDNPAQASRQDQETVKTRSYTLPTGSRIEESRVTANDAGAVVTNVEAVVVSAPMPVVEREETRAKTELGAAQKDTAREIGAKLSSLKGIVWVGVALFLFGLVSIFYPPLKLLIGSVTTSAAILVGGLALMVLPTLIVGNELLILGGVSVAVGGWFLAHRHGRLQGFVDANKDGVDDRLEKPEKAGGA